MTNLRSYLVVNAALYVAFLAIACLGLFFGVEGFSLISAYQKDISIYGGMLLTILYVFGVIHNISALKNVAKKKRAVVTNCVISGSSFMLFLSVSLAATTKIFTSSVLIYAYMFCVHYFHILPIVNMNRFIRKTKEEFGESHVGNDD